MATTNWDELTAKLFGLRRFGIKPGLGRLRSALDEQGNQGEAYPVIMVAGTNGKGTVASLIGAILQAHGYRVGLYTSPHLISVRERFRVDGEPLSREAVEPVLRRLLDVYGGDGDEKKEHLTFFEMTTLAAVSLFADCAVDFGVFEVGLGGRLDAVNALEPAISVVTTVGRDHTRYLGEEITEIAAEKAGIFRRGVPAVIGRQEHEDAHRKLVERANDAGAEPVVAERGDGSAARQDILRRHEQTARWAVEVLLGESQSDKAFDDGYKRWRWPGRFDEIAFNGDGRRGFVDAAHNAAGLRALARAVKQRDRQIGAVIWASMRDKDPGGIGEFLSHVGAPVWGSLVVNERARTAAQLRDFVPDALWQGAAVTERCIEAVSKESNGDVLIFGSVFLVGEVFAALGRDVPSLKTYVDED